MRFETLINGVWVAQKPTENGQRYKQYDEAGGVLESVWSNTVAPETTTKLTRLAFRNRFSFAEKVAIAEAAKTDAILEVLQKDQDAATFIDLSRADTQQGVQLLVSKSLLTAERAEEILSLTVLPDEEFRG